MREAMCAYAIWLHLLEEGEPVGSGFVNLLGLAEVMEGSFSDGPEKSKIKSALVVMRECNARGTWRTADLQTLNNLCNIASTSYHELKPAVARRAIETFIP